MANENALLDHPLMVHEVNEIIKETFKTQFFNLSVEGEISSFKPSANGHWYFTLKDSQSQLSCVMFRSFNARLGGVPKEGDKVVAIGNIDVYVPRGTYQLVVSVMMKAGEGDLKAQLEKRKAYYESLGYFDMEKKKPIPEIVKTIGVVTASTGAAIHDILDTTLKRAPGVDILLYPTLVQGETAAKMIAARIDQANEVPFCDVLIVGRGGGSQEDLLPFSEPEVIEAIYRSEIPVISAVGHEIDWALSDHVADRRAITPTDAAVIATEGIFKRREEIKNVENTLRSAILAKLHQAQSHFVDMEYLSAIMMRKSERISLPSQSDLFRMLSQKLFSLELRFVYASDTPLSLLKVKYNRAKDSFNYLSDQIEREGKTKLERYPEMIARAKQDVSQGFDMKLGNISMRLEKCISNLESLSPMNVLSRGYAIVKDDKGHVVTGKKGLKIDDELTILMKNGNIKVGYKGEKK